MTAPATVAPELTHQANPVNDGLADAKLHTPLALVVFGISGDLAARKLIPALYTLFRGAHLPSDFTLIGVGRREWSDSDMRAHLHKSLQDFAPHEYDEDTFNRFADAARYARVTFDQQSVGDSATYAMHDDYLQMKAMLDRLDQERGTQGNRLFYLAVAPEFYAGIAVNLGAVGLNKSAGFTRIIVEKPFGTDLQSARELNAQFRRVFEEEQIYRIDHYLGKETVQNIAVVRFGNAIFEPIWNRHYIDNVQITVSESVSVGSRGGFYDKAGAMRDILQNHALQVLCMIAMEPPVAWEAPAVRDEKVKLLRSVRQIDPSEALKYSVRGQYLAGEAGGKPIQAYLATKDVAPNSHTETYVAMKLEVNNWRWAGVPFYLRTGKALTKRITEIAIEFRSQPNSPFGNASSMPNRLLIQVQPDEGITLEFNAKYPGQNISVEPVTMNFSYDESFDVRTAEAYERLLLDAMEGNNKQFTRDDEVEAAWSIMTPFLTGWAQSEDGLPQYTPGTAGPKEADDWMHADQNQWRDL